MNRRAFCVLVWSVFCLVLTCVEAAERGDVLGILGILMELWLVMIGSELV